MPNPVVQRLFPPNRGLYIDRSGASRFRGHSSFGKQCIRCFFSCLPSPCRLTRTLFPCMGTPYYKQMVIGHNMGIPNRVPFPSYSDYSSDTVRHFYAPSQGVTLPTLNIGHCASKILSTIYPIHVSGGKKVGWFPPRDQPQKPQCICQVSTLQNGGHSSTLRSYAPRRLVHSSRSQRHLPDGSPFTRAVRHTCASIGNKLCGSFHAFLLV